MEWLIAVILVPLVVGLIALAVWSSSKRRKELTAWAAARGLSFSTERDRSLDERFAWLPPLRQGSNRYGHNICEGAAGDRRVCAFDYHYETYSTDSKGNRQTHHHTLSVVVLVTDLPLRGLSIAKEGFFDRIAEFFGADDIDFEHAQFSRQFKVKSPDRRWAFDVIHQETMEFLMSMPRFSITMAQGCVAVFDGTVFRPDEFDAALRLADGLVDRLPASVLRELSENA